LTSLEIVGIGVLATCQPGAGHGPLGLVEDATVVVDGERVVYAGPARGAPGGAERRWDAGGRSVTPGLVDSHTHLVFAGDRAAEFAQRMAGRPYRPGGIATTVTATRAATPAELHERGARLVAAARAGGTTTLEIKTGYGLTVEHELAQLDIAATLTPEATLLGAHLVPPEWEGDRAGYVRLVAEEMVPAAAGRARWCDVFCEAGAFDVDESRTVLAAAAAAGLGLRVHAHQLGRSGGVALACEMGAASADHCTFVDDADVDALVGAGVVATLLPITEFCTRQPYPDGRRLLDAGARVALASNCNPGSGYSTSMPLAMAIAVREMGFTVDEAIWAATRGGAAALRRSDIGCLVAGARADLVVLDAPHPHHLVYQLGMPVVAGAMKDGEWATLPRPRGAKRN
jgi:imidazolonepropionase